MIDETPWGPTGKVVYDRTYSRTKPNGQRETWPETVRRVVHGNLALVYGPMGHWNESVWKENDELVAFMERFAILPAGRHLWASGVRGRQFLYNCHVSGWTEKLSDHYEFSFMRLMEGGGVGANYSSDFLKPYGPPRRALRVHIVCDPSHADYAEMKEAGVLSDEFSYEWEGAFPVEDSREGWAAAMVDLIDTYMTDAEVKHPDRVYDVSRVRGKGQPLRTFGGTASGPGPFARMMLGIADVLNGFEGRWKSVSDYLSPVEAMEIEHAISECVVSGGVRRSARMSIVRWDDFHIFDFLRCKQDPSKHWTTNISVEVDDRFNGALADHHDPHHELAKRVHEEVVRGMLTNGEPGYWNSSLTNFGEVNRVIATNPCGEIGLPAWGACVLGHVNLDAFASTPERPSTDFVGLGRAHELMTRFLIRATYGDMTDDKQREVMQSERRIGVGHLGVQGFLVKHGIRYSEAPDSEWFREGLTVLYERVRETARSYAFELRIPEPVKVTTVAPTGSIAKLPGVTEGIHPIYARHFLRRVRFNNTDPGNRILLDQAEADGFEVEQDIYDASGNTVVVVYPTEDKLVSEVRELGLSVDLVESADEIPLDRMLLFQAMYQRFYADNAVSFTANVPEGLDLQETMDWIQHFLPVVKGTTVMVDGTRPQAPYERISEADFQLYEHTRIEDSTDDECATGACPIR